MAPTTLQKIVVTDKKLLARINDLSRMTGRSVKSLLRTIMHEALERDLSRSRSSFNSGYADGSIRRDYYVSRMGVEPSKEIESLRKGLQDRHLNKLFIGGAIDEYTYTRESGRNPSQNLWNQRRIQESLLNRIEILASEASQLPLDQTAELLFKTFSFGEKETYTVESLSTLDEFTHFSDMMGQ